MIFTICSLLFLGFLLYRNHSQDKGSHRHAKAFHAVALALAVLLGALSFGVVASQVQHFTAFAKHFSISVGWVPGSLNLMAAVLAPIFEMILFLAAFAAAQRNAIAVQIFRVVLLASIPTLVICIYVNIAATTTVAPGLVIAALVLVAVKLGLFFFYGSRMMKEFLAVRIGPATP